MRSHSYLPPGRGSISHSYHGRYSIHPLIKDEQLSRPEPTQVNAEVSAIPGVSWLSRPSVPLGTVGVHNLPTVVMQCLTSADLNPHLSNTLSTRPRHHHSSSNPDTWCNHDLVLLRPDSEECQIVLRIDVSHTVARLCSQTVQQASILHRRRVVQSRPHRNAYNETSTVLNASWLTYSTLC